MNSIPHIQRRPRTYAWPKPASGAWQPDMGPGYRKFFHLSPHRPFVLDGGGLLHDPVLAYESWGTLNSDASNAVLICHALTGDSHAYGPSDPPSQMTSGWWNDMIGPNRPIDTERYFAVCANVLGGCQGSTGPSSTDPLSGKRYGLSFPVVTNRDVARSQNALSVHLGIDRWMSVIGGSMGGMAALEWAVTYPKKLHSVVVIAAAAQASPQQIAWSKVGRQAILDDPGFRNGSYYDAKDGTGPHKGLANARRIAMIHYRSSAEFDRRFSRNSEEPLQPLRLDHRFDIESYLDHQADKFIPRFDANSYLILNKMMDLHDIGRSRGGVEQALNRITVPSLTMSVSTDCLYPISQQLQIVNALEKRNLYAKHICIQSDNGHDGFLTEPDQVGPPIGKFLDRIQNTDKDNNAARPQQAR